MNTHGVESVHDTLRNRAMAQSAHDKTIGVMDALMRDREVVIGDTVVPVGSIANGNRVRQRLPMSVNK